MTTKDNTVSNVGIHYPYWQCNDCPFNTNSWHRINQHCEYEHGHDTYLISRHYTKVYDPTLQNKERK